MLFLWEWWSFSVLQHNLFASVDSKWIHSFGCLEATGPVNSIGMVDCIYFPVMARSKVFSVVFRSSFWVWLASSASHVGGKRGVGTLKGGSFGIECIAA